jgi:nicotinate phosphoribosyltransferase
LFDDSNLGYVKIIASGGLDENTIEALVKAGAPIDMFGVGTQMATSGDVPWLEMAYKIVNYAGRPILKLSPGKISLPEEKQAFRLRNPDGTFKRDVISLADESPPEANSEPLLETFMEAGRVVRQIPLLEDARRNFRQDIVSLERRFKLLSSPSEYPVELSHKLLELQKSLEKDIRQRNTE